MEIILAESVNPRRMACSEAAKLKAGKKAEEKMRKTELTTMLNRTFTDVYRLPIMGIHQEGFSSLPHQSYAITGRGLRRFARHLRQRLFVNYRPPPIDSTR